MDTRASVIHSSLPTKDLLTVFPQKIINFLEKTVICAVNL